MTLRDLSSAFPELPLRLRQASRIRVPGSVRILPIQMKSDTEERGRFSQTVRRRGLQAITQCGSPVPLPRSPLLLGLSLRGELTEHRDLPLLDDPIQHLE